MQERWKPVKGYKGKYKVSNAGRVKSMPRTRPYPTGPRKINGRVLVKIKGKQSGYMFVSLCKNGVVKQHKVSRLVAIAFIPNPKNKPTVNHRNGDKANDTVSNLEWATHKENHKHASKFGLKAFGERNSSATITQKIAVKIKRLMKAGWKRAELMKRFKLSPMAYHGIKRGLTWRKTPKQYEKLRQKVVQHG